MRAVAQFGIHLTGWLSASAVLLGRCVKFSEMQRSGLMRICSCEEGPFEGRIAGTCPRHLIVFPDRCRMQLSSDEG